MFRLEVVAVPLKEKVMVLIEARTAEAHTYRLCCQSVCGSKRKFLLPSERYGTP
jgi:hypothetical protein